jgi:hypothetical protein
MPKTKEMTKKTLFLLIFIFFNLIINAQNYQSLGINKIIETKWRYAYMLHLESGTVLHKADLDYNYFVYFRADLTYQQMLNGQFSQGIWSYGGDRLQYHFRDIIDFSIIKIDENQLILEFTRANSRGHFQYYFTNAIEKNPFPKPNNELPLVTVKRTLKLPWWLTKTKDKNPTTQAKVEPTYINIELIGGGYYGGVDPVTRDIIHIKSDGRLIKEFQTKEKGLVINKKNIPRAELEKFCEFVVNQKFFDFEREYNCESEVCERRKRQKPTPIPLRLSIAYGSRKKVISISIWGIDEQRVRYIQYPPALDNIIDAIQRFALRSES